MNSPTPVLTDLQVALVRYRNALEFIEDSKKPFGVKQALDILAARDALHKQLEAEGAIPGNYSA